MSVIYFSADELANLAAAVAGKAHAAQSEEFARLKRQCAESLAEYSQCNAKAFNRTYRDQVRGLSYGAIYGAKIKEPNLAQAKETAARLRHNAVSADGHDYLQSGVAKKVLDIVQKLVN